MLNREAYIQKLAECGFPFNHIGVGELWEECSKLNADNDLHMETLHGAVAAGSGHGKTYTDEAGDPFIALAKFWLSHPKGGNISVL